MRLIDADAMKARLGMGHECDECDDPRACRYDGFYAKRDFCLSIDDEPTVEECKTGKWIDEGQYTDFSPQHAFCCSECGQHFLEIEMIYDYCPHCGARMVNADGEEEECNK